MNSKFIFSIILFSLFFSLIATSASAGLFGHKLPDTQIFIEQFNESSLDNICSDDQSFMYRYNDTYGWGCGKLNSTDFDLTITTENITYVEINSTAIEDIETLGFNITSCTDTDVLTEGTLCWNPDDHTLNIVSMGGTVIQSGQEILGIGINKAGVDLTDGSVVVAAGFQGDRMTFIKADGTSPSLSAMMGILTQDCSINEECFVNVFGFVRDIDTSSWTSGDKLYLDPSNPGTLTNVIPTLPNNPLWLATVNVVHANVGSIFVNPSIDPSDGFLINSIYATGGATFLGDVNIGTNLIVNGTYDWTSGDNWNIFDGHELTFNVSKLSTTYYAVNSSALYVGTLTGGSLLDTVHTDGHYDSVTVNISETAGSPALEMRMNFTDIDSFNQGIIRYKTSDLVGEAATIQIWDYNLLAWESYPEITESEEFKIIERPIFDYTKYVQGGLVQMRIYKSSNGNTNNDYFFDWITIAKGFGTPAGEEVDPVSFHKTGSIPMEGNADWGNYNLTNVQELNITQDAFINELIICDNGTATIMTRNSTLATLRGCNL